MPTDYERTWGLHDSRCVHLARPDDGTRIVGYLAIACVWGIGVVCGLVWAGSQ